MAGILLVQVRMVAQEPGRNIEVHHRRGSYHQPMGPWFRQADKEDDRA